MAVVRSPRWKVTAAEEEDRERVLAKREQWSREKEDIRRQLRTVTDKKGRHEVIDRLKLKKILKGDESKHFKRVKYVLRDMMRDRRMLHKTCAALKGLFEKPKESQEEIERRRQASFLQQEGAFLRKKPTELTDEEKITFFRTEQVLSPREQELRALAKELRVPLDHADRIKKIFRSIGKEAPSSIDRAEFDQITKVMSSGVELRPKVVEDWWREICRFGNGKAKTSVAFKDFLRWTALQNT